MLSLFAVANLLVLYGIRVLIKVSYLMLVLLVLAYVLWKMHIC